MTTYNHVLIPAIHTELRRSGVVVVTGRLIHEFFPPDPRPSWGEMMTRVMGALSSDEPAAPLTVKTTKDKVAAFCQEHGYTYQYDLMSDQLTLCSSDSLTRD